MSRMTRSHNVTTIMRGGTNKQKTKPANGMASEQQKDLCINTG